MMQLNKSFKSKYSFTLVELLVVIGILAILTAAVVIVLNPAELLKQSRDSKRTTDLANLNNAIKLLLTQNPDINLGSASTVYISLVDSSSTCGSYALPGLPSGWQYRCVTAADYQKTDGSGWIPVSFTAAGSVASLASLPVDPQNTLQNYYTYVSGGSWELATSFESAKYAAKEADDGGLDPAGYEIGSDLTLAPFFNGLVGYWSFDEGSGITAYDKSGNGNNGTLMWDVLPAWTSAGKAGGALSFLNGYVETTPIILSQSFSYSVWFKMNSSVDWAAPVSNLFHSAPSSGANIVPRAGGVRICYGDGVNSYKNYSINVSEITIGQWANISVTYDGAIMNVYVNGTLKDFRSVTIAQSSRAARMGIWAVSHQNYFFNGLIDEVRIYNRALTAAEVQAIYNATK